VGFSLAVLFSFAFSFAFYFLVSMCIYFLFSSLPQQHAVREKFGFVIDGWYSKTIKGKGATKWLLQDNY